MLKRTLLTVALVAGSSQAMAEAAGGSGCGWGNMLWEGKKGTPIHVLAITTNDSTGSNTFGVSSGTNGCSGASVLTYRGKAWMGADVAFMQEFSEDVAKGHGDAMTAVAVNIGIEQQDRQVFAEVMHKNFNAIFTYENITAEEVMLNMANVMKADERLSKYVG